VWIYNEARFSWNARAGLLTLEGGWLTLRDERAVVFQVPIQSARIDFPKRWFGLGVRVEVEGKRWRLGLVAPDPETAQEPDYGALGLTGLETDLAGGLPGSKAWKAATGRS
jgi:hypothetical protein